MRYAIVLDPRALHDIQEAIAYYDEQEAGLGARFEEGLEAHFETLTHSPFFQVRYKNVRCLPMKKYPYILHFTVDEILGIVYIYGVIHTRRDADKRS